MHITALTPNLGVEVTGLDLADAVAAPMSDWSQLVTQLLTQHGVVAYRDQSLDREQHKAVGRLFGELHIHPSQRGPKATGDREIFTVTSENGTGRVNGGRWHSDVSCDTNPPGGSILRLLEGPPSGGNTLFADMHRAFTTLSAPIRDLLVGLDAEHDQRRDLRWYGYEPIAGVTYPACAHPVVTSHPITCLPLLFVNEAFTERIVGLGDHESAAILAMLYDHIARRPDLHCRIRWQPGTVVMWDNRAVQHHAVDYYAPYLRHAERVTFSGARQPEPWTPS